MGAAKRKLEKVGRCGSCGFLLHGRDSDGGGEHIEFECIENLQERHAHLLEALKATQRFLEALYRERPLLDDGLVKSLQETEQRVRGVLSADRGES